MSKKIKKIILVEDDEAIADIYGTMIRKANFDIEIINSGEEAIRIIKDISNGETPKPDLIILDLILPDINGIQVFSEIKKYKLTKNIKVFILTNQGSSELEWPDNKRPDQFLIKANISTAELLKLIKSSLK